MGSEVVYSCSGENGYGDVELFLQSRVSIGDFGFIRLADKSVPRDSFSSM